MVCKSHSGNVRHQGQGLPEVHVLQRLPVVTKSQLVQAIHDHCPHFGRQTVEDGVDVLFAQITAALQRGQRVELRGFGSFGLRKRSGGISRNPQTGVITPVTPRAIPFFKPGKNLLDVMNQPIRSERVRKKKKGVGFFVTTHYTPLKENLRDGSKSPMTANEVTLIIWRAGNSKGLKNFTRLASGGDLRHLKPRKGSFSSKNVLGGTVGVGHKPFRG